MAERQGRPGRIGALLRALTQPGTWVALAFLAGIFVLQRWLTSIGGPEALPDRYGLWAPLLSVPIQAALSTAPLPSELFTVAAGSAYGWALGTAVGIAGWTCGSMIQYGLARRGSASLDVEGHFERLPRWLQRVPVGQPTFLIVGRWLPMGYHLVNIISGARRVPATRHLWTAAVGSVPGAMLWAAIGAGIELL